MLGFDFCQKTITVLCNKSMNTFIQRQIVIFYSSFGLGFLRAGNMAWQNMHMNLQQKWEKEEIGSFFYMLQFISNCKEVVSLKNGANAVGLSGDFFDV